MGKIVVDVSSFSYFIMLYIGQDDSRHLVFRTLIPGGGIPEWFSHQNEGAVVLVETSPNWNNSNFLGFAICVVLGLKDVMHYLSCSIEDVTFDFGNSLPLMCDFIPFNFEDGLIKSDHIWLAYAPASSCKNWNPNSIIRISFCMYGDQKIINSCGVRLVCTEDLSNDNATMIQDISAPQLSSVVLEEIKHSVAEDSGVKRSLDSGPGAVEAT